MKPISQGAQYAISAVIALAKLPEGTTVSAADLAEPLHCPPAYLSQLLSRLKPAGIITSHRGYHGGVCLARKPDQISIMDVVSVIDGMELFENCFLGIEGCGEVEPCPFHDFWSAQRQTIEEWLTETTFADCEKQMTQKWFDLRLNY